MCIIKSLNEFICTSMYMYTINFILTINFDLKSNCYTEHSYLMNIGRHILHTNCSTLYTYDHCCIYHFLYECHQLMFSSLQIQQLNTHLFHILQGHIAAFKYQQFHLHQHFHINFINHHFHVRHQFNVSHQCHLSH